MTCKNSTLTQERLKEVLSYNAETGGFVWLITTNNNKAHIGATAGCNTVNGYRAIAIDRIEYYAHRLAWLYIYGVWPDQIDHINGIRNDNRIINLRDVNYMVNGKNMGMYSNNKTGITGVCWDKSRNKWMATIAINCKQINLGRFDKIDDAAKARKDAEIKYGFHPNHGLER